MKHTSFCTAGHTGALDHAAAFLRREGFAVTAPGPDATHLLLPVPSFEPDGTIKGGGSLKEVLSTLSSDIIVIGGNLDHRDLDKYRTLDLLSNPFYVSENAAITAHCALKYLLNSLPVTLSGQPVLIIGWGRIGKCLGQLLKSIGAEVTIAARKATDRAMAEALGYRSSDPDLDLSNLRVILNTAPAPVLTEAQTAQCRPDCLKIDLASKKGIPGSDVIWARGLPGKDAPESSGELIAKTVIRMTQGKEHSI